jgi:hypothetical protein
MKGTEEPSAQGYEPAKQDQKVGEQWQDVLEVVEVAVVIMANQGHNQIKVAKYNN